MLVCRYMYVCWVFIDVVVLMVNSEVAVIFIGGNPINS